MGLVSCSFLFKNLKIYICLGYSFILRDIKIPEPVDMYSLCRLVVPSVLYTLSVVPYFQACVFAAMLFTSPSDISVYFLVAYQSEYVNTACSNEG